MNMQEGLTPAESAICGGFAGLVSRMVVAPLDVVKIRLQLQSSHHPAAQAPPRYHGVLRTIQLIVREEGWTALWKGNLTAQYLYLAYGAVQFSTYQKIRASILHEQSPGKSLSQTSASFLAGSISGAIATSLSYPLDLLRTRLASQGRAKVYTRLYPSIRSILKTEGVSGLYRGLFPSLLQISPYMGLMFGSYDLFRRHIGPYAAPHLPDRSIDAACGAAAGVLSKTGVFPLDLVRKRLQVQGPSRTRYAVHGIPRYGRSWTHAFLHILRYEGPIGLYRGLFPSLIKAAPASAATFWAFGLARSFLV
ncbi:mitochondrial carrier domain-containing protein [Piptocephalis cylindrospora]|uniref:Mitochondrial carrier domain-containing protein n=1 Tax=Piptocephalis cylindrospora TaxID=1907219 RepID=A0A4V1IXX6_9FUNG|nr:mitochondrial carrier domain-containing protein [Piptocephalis cylindrospora]|eukprot:RKP12589.1 mitochondrial carrier domain-containing protein [Piptocephalis cylindrospora]